MTSPSRKRPRAAAMFPRVVVALDLDCFYASVAIRARPHLKDLPVGVFQKHLVVTTNYVARSLGVQKMTWTRDALRVCPQLNLIDGSDLAPFRAANAEVLAVVRSWLNNSYQKHVHNTTERAALVSWEKLGLDEVFIDFTKLVQLEMESTIHNWQFAGHTFGTPDDDFLRRVMMIASHLVRNLRETVIEKVNLTLCAGISSNKLLAKLAVNMHKPNDQTVFFEDSARAHIATLAPRALPGFGHAMSCKLKEWAKEKNVPMETNEQLLTYFDQGAAREDELSQILGNPALGKTVIAWCKGRDETPVKNTGPPKVMTCEDSFRSCTDMDDVKRRLTELIDELLGRLIEDRVEWGFRLPKTLTVRYRFKGHGYHSTSRAVPMPLNVVSYGVYQKDARAMKAAVASILRAALVILRDHAGVSCTNSFNLSLLSVGATNFNNGPVHEKLTGHTIERFLQRPVGSPWRTTSEHCNDDSNTKQMPTQIVPAKVNRTKDESPTCPICQQVLPLGNIAQNAHIDSCLSPADSSRKVSPQQKVKTARLNSKARTIEMFFKKE